jgi:hypothetical protein
MTNQSKKPLTKGERNNNWGNIRYNPKIKGVIGKTPDNFSVFSSPEMGVRGIFVILKSYKDKGFDTIEEIITRYAPSSENNTRAYIQAVSRATGIDPKKKIDIEDPAILFPLTKAIVRHENGKDLLTFEIFENAKSLWKGFSDSGKAAFSAFVLFALGYLLSVLK